MKVSDEMVAAFKRAWHAADDAGTHGVDGVRTRAGLEAVLALIEPIPDSVHRVKDRDGDTWRRNMIDSGIWRCEDDPSLVIASPHRLIEDYGPITWEGKA